jgi:PPOX class probable FMN-dependent enzyme
MQLTDRQELRALYGEPGERARKKQLAALDVHCRNFIARSPFLVIGSAGPGGADVSPKGDAPGFVAVLDERTLLIPDRPGNNRVDTMQNILDHPEVGVLFFVPGMNETLRVNGRAAITTDPALLEPLAVNGKVPKTGLRIEVREAFLHCAKALMRSNLWDPGTRIERSEFPTMGKMLADQIGLDHSPETEQADQEKLRNSLY